MRAKETYCCLIAQSLITIMPEMGLNFCTYTSTAPIRANYAIS